MEERDRTSGPFCFLLLLEPRHLLLPLSVWIFVGYSLALKMELFEESGLEVSC